MEVFFSDLAESKLNELVKKLLEEWSYKVKMDFLSKLDDKIQQISSHPESCPKSMQFGGFYKCVVTKQTTFFYRIHFKREEIEIISLIDNRQDPDKTKKLLE